jgi:hypothetical protein
MPGDEGLSTENIKRGILELAESIVPGTIEPLIKYMESAEAAKATKDGLGVSSSGFPLRANDIWVWSRFGIRPSTIDVKRSMRFALSKDIRSMSQSRKEFKNFIRTMPVKDYGRPENKQELLDVYRRYQEQKLMASKRFAEQLGLYKNISYTDSEGKRRKFGLDQVIMAATDDGYYERGRDVEAIALANAEVDNYRRGIFLPDELNTSDEFIKMLTDKGVPLNILEDLAKINQEYYSRTGEGLVNMNIGGYIGDFFKNLLGVSPLNVGEEEQLKIALEQGQIPTAPLPKVKPKLEDDNNKTEDKEEIDYSISKFNNPGNIEQGINWKGLAKGGYGPNERFAKFKTPESGIRALKIDINTKLNRFNGDLRKVIEQYAPSSENDVDKYLQVVQKTAGIKDKYTEKDLDNIVKGFIRMENKKELADKYIKLIENKGN